VTSETVVSARFYDTDEEESFLSNIISSLMSLSLGPALCRGETVTMCALSLHYQEFTDTRLT